MNACVMQGVALVAFPSIQPIQHAATEQFTHGDNIDESLHDEWKCKYHIIKSIHYQIDQIALYLVYLDSLVSIHSALRVLPLRCSMKILLVE